MGRYHPQARFRRVLARSEKDIVDLVNVQGPPLDTHVNGFDEKFELNVGICQECSPHS